MRLSSSGEREEDDREDADVRARLSDIRARVSADISWTGGRSICGGWVELVTLADLDTVLDGARDDVEERWWDERDGVDETATSSSGRSPNSSSSAFLPLSL